MTNPHGNREERPSIAEILAGLPEDQRKEAEARVEHYLEIALQIYEHACSDPVRYKKMLDPLEEERKKRSEEVA